jgi:hypothetical protein
VYKLKKRKNYALIIGAILPINDFSGQQIL